MLLFGAAVSSPELWQLDFLSSLFDGGSETFRATIALCYRYEALGAVPLGLNAAMGRRSVQRAPCRRSSAAPFQHQLLRFSPRQRKLSRKIVSRLDR